VIIHSEHRIRKERTERKKVRGKRWWRILLVTSLVFNILIFCGVIIGGSLAVKKAIKKGKFQHSFENASNKFKRQVLGVVYNIEDLFMPHIPKTYIDIKFKYYKKLLDKREEAIKLGWLKSSDDDFVPATLKYRNQVIPIDLRLKGDLPEHWSGEKWSMRIKTKGDGFYKGMSRFSIQSPERRAYINEFCYLYNLRLEGILAPRYEFIDVVINGKNKGIYALEESFTKETMESQQRREGVIIKFNENAYWDQIIDWPDHQDRSYIPHDPAYFNLTQRTWLNTDLDVWEKAHILKNPYLEKQRDIALGLLASFISGEKKASEVFDVDLLAKFFAVTYLWGGDHAFGWQNINFYYNPVTSKLEPIGFDSMSGGRMDEQTYGEIATGKRYPNYPWGYFDWVLVALQDKKVAEKYIKECERVSSSQYLEWVKNELKGPLSQQTRILWKDAPETIEWEAIEYNRKFLRSCINPVRQIDVYANNVVEVSNNQNSISLSISNLLALPVELVGVRVDGNSIVPFSNKEKIVLDGIKGLQLPLDKEICNFSIPVEEKYVVDGKLINKTKVEVVSRLLGSQKDYITEAVMFSRSKFIESIPESPSIEEFLQKYSLANYDKSDNTIYITSGVWLIEDNMILPEGCRLTVFPGAVLKFKSGKFLLVRGPVRMVGSDDGKITLCAQEDNWAGLAVLDKYGESILENVVIKDCTGVENNDWILTGAVTFYQSKLYFNKVLIENMMCEDGVNLIHTDYIMANSIFMNTKSDALDNDFCEGIINNIVFMDINADALDVSGTKLKIDNMKAYRLGDKGLSVGEKSDVYAQNIVVDGADFGAASKDSSKLEIDNMQISNTKFGLAAYQKKPEYGPAEIQANNMSFQNVGKEILRQNGSKVYVNGKDYPAEDVNVDRLYEKWKGAK